MPRCGRFSRFRAYDSSIAERPQMSSVVQTDASVSSSLARARFFNDSLSRVEYKTVEEQEGHSLNTNGWRILMNGIARGDDSNQRTGREVVMLSVLHSYSLSVASSTGTDCRVRVLIVYDRQCNSLAPDITDILSSQTVQSARNLVNVRRFSIIYDVVHVLNSYNEPYGQNYRKFYRHLRHPVTFNSGSTGTITDIISGSLYFFAFSTVSGVENLPVISYHFRVRYVDN